MNNPVFYPIRRSLLVAEGSRHEEYAACDKNKFAEEEIADIRAVLQKLTTTRILNPTDAEDLVQETLLTLITKRPANELEKGLLVWSMGILRKKVGNYYRKAQRLTYFSEQKVSAEQVLLELALSASPESILFHNELTQLIQEALSGFPAPQRRAIELLIAGYNSGEIAEELNPERYQSAINYIHRGRKRLAQELAKFGYGPEAQPGMHSLKRCRPQKRQDKTRIRS